MARGFGGGIKARGSDRWVRSWRPILDAVHLARSKGEGRVLGRGPGPWARPPRSPRLPGNRDNAAPISRLSLSIFRNRQSSGGLRLRTLPPSELPGWLPRDLRPGCIRALRDLGWPEFKPERRGGSLPGVILSRWPR